MASRQLRKTRSLCNNSRMSFTRIIEDFVCAHCGQRVVGNGFTNHCPACLWSKHVDNDPGDRAATCGGQMRPVRLEGSTPSYRIIHRCERCEVERAVKTAEADNPEALVALSKRV